MSEINISEFKAKCLALVEQVHKTKKPLRITKFGKPIAEVVPYVAENKRENWLGCMKGKMEIIGDIISPVIDENEFEAMRD
jgi:prevent-host-death family protein